MNRIGGARRKTRQKLTKASKNKGKISIRSYLRIFKEGDRVQLAAEPSVQKGTYYLRYYGKKGIIKSKAGRLYNVIIKDKNVEKTILVHPVHLKRL